MILDPQDQQHEVLANPKRAKTINIALFYMGGILIVCHDLIGLAAIVCVFSNLASPPSWLWIEMKLLVYPLTFILWFRLLSIARTYRLYLPQAKQYLFIAAISCVALVSVLNLFAWYALAALPLLSVTYIAQWILDVRLPSEPQRKPHTQTASQHSTSIQTKKPSHTHHAGNLPSSQGVTTLKQTVHTDEYIPHCPSQQVVIWYNSEADGRFARQLHTHLQPKVWQGAIKLWDIGDIQPGDNWQKKRSQAVQSAGVAVLLISADFMAHDLIAHHELPQMLLRAQTQGTVILLLHVSPCDLTGSGLEKFYPLNPPNKPLAKLTRANREEILKQTVLAICQRLGLCL